MEQPQSPSMHLDDYWWYTARSAMLRTIVEPAIGEPKIVLDVGSADGPSVDWMKSHGRRIALDLDFSALKPGDVCGSALELPFADGVFDAITAFDVLEHCEPESQAVNEFVRVLRPGGFLAIAVPSYQWAWTQFDVEIGHYRRYTKRRLVKAMEAGGISVQRATYMFGGVFPIFAGQRLLSRMRPAVEDATVLPQPSKLQERVLLSLCALDQKVLPKRDVPFGSSVVAIGHKR